MVVDTLVAEPELKVVYELPPFVEYCQVLQETLEVAAIVMVLFVELEELIVMVGAVRSRLVSAIVVEPVYVPIFVEELFHASPNVKLALMLMLFVPSELWETV